MSRIYLSGPDVAFEERQAVLSAIDSNWVAPVGPDLDAFEAELSAWTDSQHVVGVSSGTAALHLAMLLLGVGPGDEVIVPTTTFVPSANAAVYVGARPVFIDIEPTTWCLSPDLTREFLEQRAKNGNIPKAAVVVDLYGQCADYRELIPIFREYHVAIVEDAAEALGAKRDGLSAGSFGAIGALSFNGNKIITTSSGGALLTDDSAVRDHARKLATQAKEPLPYYEHIEMGYNYRLSNLLAAFGRAQLASLAVKIQRRREINEMYRSAFADLEGVDFLQVPDSSEPNYWLSCITVDPGGGRTWDDVRCKLEEHDIESRPTWKPLHMQPLFRGAESHLDGTSEWVFERGLCLPSGSSLTNQQFERVASIVADFLLR